MGDQHGLVIPGLINAHTHLSEALIPGMGETLALFDWAPAVIVPASRQLDREMAHVGALLKGIELVSSGVTCVNDQFGHMNLGSMASLGSVDGLVEIGLRGVVSFGAADSPTGEVSLEAGQIVEEHRALAAHCASTDRIGFRVGLATMLVATDELLAATVSVAAELGAGVHTHLAEVREEVVDAKRRWGVSAVRRAADIGLLDHDVVAGHVIWVEVDEYDLLADQAVRAVYNPVANMILADGICPVVELQRAGVTVAIGTDGAASNDSQDMLGVLKAGALLQKVSKMDPAWCTARDVVRLATTGGAVALGLADQVGSLEPGKQADVVRLAGDRPGLANVHDPLRPAGLLRRSHRRGRRLGRRTPAPGRPPPHHRRRARRHRPQPRAGRRPRPGPAPVPPARRRTPRLIRPAFPPTIPPRQPAPPSRPPAVLCEVVHGRGGELGKERRGPGVAGGAEWDDPGPSPRARVIPLPASVGPAGGASCPPEDPRRRSCRGPS